MAISFVAFSHETTTTGSEPTSSAENDILVAAVFGGTGAAHANADWTQISTQYDNSSFRVSTWYVKRPSSAPNYIWTAAGGASHITICSYRGCDPDNPLNTSTVSNTSNTTPSVTTTVINCLLIAVYTDLSVTSSIPLGFTDRTGATFGPQFADLQLTSAGATGTHAWGNPTGGGAPHGNYAIALAPRVSSPRKGARRLL